MAANYPGTVALGDMAWYPRFPVAAATDRVRVWAYKLGLILGAALGATGIALLPWKPQGSLLVIATVAIGLGLFLPSLYAIATGESPKPAPSVSASDEGSEDE